MTDVDFLLLYVDILLLYVININNYSMFMRSLFKFMHRWENVDSINVAQNRDDMAVVNTVMNLLYPYNEQNLWTG